MYQEDDSHQQFQTGSSRVQQHCSVKVIHCKDYQQEDNNKSSNESSDEHNTFDKDIEGGLNDGADGLQELDGTALVSALSSEVIIYSHDAQILLLSL
jgi:hypothetical protein